MKLSVQTGREIDNEYEKEADDDFRPLSQQPSQPAHHGLEENPLGKYKDASISNYQLDPKHARSNTSLEVK